MNKEGKLVLKSTLTRKLVVMIWQVITGVLVTRETKYRSSVSKDDKIQISGEKCKQNTDRWLMQIFENVTCRTHLVTSGSGQIHSKIDYKSCCCSASNLFSKSRSPNLFLLRNNPQFTLAKMHQFCSFEVWK